MDTKSDTDKFKVKVNSLLVSTEQQTTGMKENRSRENTLTHFRQLAPGSEPEDREAKIPHCGSKVKAADDTRRMRPRDIYSIYNTKTL